MKKKLYKLFIITIILIILLSNNFAVYADEISIEAKAALIVEANTGKIIYEKDMEEKNYPASTTKVLTAILALENCNLDDTVTVSQSALSQIPSGYVVAPLFVGEQIKVKDLLYALLLKSSNDAAYVLAEHVGGSVEGFVDMMNKKAKELGCHNSNFVNPNGTHDVNHYTTAYDMYLISNYAMKNKTFAEIVSTYEYILPATNKHPYSNRIMENSNKFINPEATFYNKNVKGIKTGTTKQAGNCLITESSDKGLEILTVILGAETEDSRFTETSKMMEYAYDNYTKTKIHNKGDIIKSVEVEKATKKTKSLNLIASEDITAMHNIEIKADEVEPEITLKENIVAPIKAGQELGTVKYNIDGIEYTAKLLAGHDVECKTYYIEILVGSCAVILMAFVIKRKKSR